MSMIDAIEKLQKQLAELEKQILQLQNSSKANQVTNADAESSSAALEEKIGPAYQVDISNEAMSLQAAEEEKNCLEQMAKGDEEARNILIERNLRLVAHVAKKYSNSKVDQDDLISIGSIGLIKGINSFNLEKGARLSTYVSRCIDNEILMHLRATKKLGAEVYLNEPIRQRQR